MHLVLKKIKKEHMFLLTIGHHHYIALLHHRMVIGHEVLKRDNLQTRILLAVLWAELAQGFL